MKNNWKNILKCIIVGKNPIASCIGKFCLIYLFIGKISSKKQFQVDALKNVIDLKIGFLLIIIYIKKEVSFVTTYPTTIQLNFSGGCGVADKETHYSFLLSCRLLKRLKCENEFLK